MFASHAATSQAQPVSPAPVSEPLNTAIDSRPPEISSLHKLEGANLVQALRRGGLVLFMRHAHTGLSATDSPCGGESIVSAEGKTETLAVGKAMRDIQIPVTKRLASRTCRARQTAELLQLGSVETDESLNAVSLSPDSGLGGRRSALLNAVPPQGGNTLLVSHVHASQTPEHRLHLDLGEVIVFRPNPDGLAFPVARIKVPDWNVLLQAVGKS